MAVGVGDAAGVTAISTSITTTTLIETTSIISTAATGIGGNITLRTAAMPHTVIVAQPINSVATPVATATAGLTIDRAATAARAIEDPAVTAARVIVAPAATAGPVIAQAVIAAQVIAGRVAAIGPAPDLRLHGVTQAAIVSEDAILQWAALEVPSVIVVSAEVQPDLQA